MFPPPKSDAPKKHISELTADMKVFWEPLFDSMGLVNPVFGAKLGYNGQEFGEPRVPCVRFFPSEMSSGHDFYLELHDWDQNLFHEGERILYRRKFDPEWESNPQIVEALTKTAASTYVVRVSDLEVINRTSAVAARPETLAKKVVAKPVVKTPKPAPILSEPEDTLDEAPFTEMYEEGEDDHYSKMTIRDLYSIMNNVPASNKRWLNKLIQKNTPKG